MKGVFVISRDDSSGDQLNPTLTIDRNFVQANTVLNTVNLPDDERELLRIVDWSARSFDARLKNPFQREYVFVLEEPRSEREIIVSRVRRFSPWVLGVLAAVPLAPALSQNLDAGKSPFFAPSEEASSPAVSNPARGGPSAPSCNACRSACKGSGFAR